MRTILRTLVAVVLVSAATAHAETQQLQCTYLKNVRETCGQYGCLPVSGDPDDFNGAPGFCGRCQDDAHCGGSHCDRATGTCGGYDEAHPPPPVWPHFNLLTADATFNLAGGGSSNPIIGAGYLFQGAFRSLTPEQLPDRSWRYADLPSWYWNAGLSLALAGDQQNVFAEVGLTHYAPDRPLFLTTISLSALYQRQGDKVWDLTDSHSNFDRIGPALTFGFLQNVFLRGAYEIPIDGQVSAGWLLSIIYSKDLESDIVPDRFRRFADR